MKFVAMAATLWPADYYADDNLWRYDYHRHALDA